MDRAYILPGEVIGPKCEVPWNLTGETYEGHGPMLGWARPLSTEYVDHRDPVLFDPDDYRSDASSVPGSRIPRSGPNAAGGISPLDARKIDAATNVLASPSGKGRFFGRFRRG